MSRKSHLSKHKRKQDDGELNTQQIISVVRQEVRSYSGPIPDVEQMKGYEALCPGATRELIEMAKKAQEHQIEMDRAEVKMQSEFVAGFQRRFAVGQRVASVWLLLTLVVGAYFAYLGFANSGAVLL